MVQQRQCTKYRKDNRYMQAGLNTAKIVYLTREKNQGEYSKDATYLTQGSHIRYSEDSISDMRTMIHRGQMSRVQDKCNGFIRRKE